MRASRWMVAPGVAQGLKIITEKGSTRVAKFCV